MTSRICRLLPMLAGDGPDQMAFDEAMLDEVAKRAGPPSLRFYTWSVPTLSLGYFQAIEGALREARWRDAPIVRRPTGGGALWHEHEITYALAIPSDHALSRRPTDLYRSVHLAIAKALLEERVVASIRGESGGTEPAYPVEKPFLCFADRADDDLVSLGSKIVGSAQRRRAGAVLQHGSLLLRTAGKTPELPGIAELSQDAPSDPRYWAGLLGRTIASTLGPLLEDSEPTPTERELSKRLATEEYRSDARTWKR